VQKISSHDAARLTMRQSLAGHKRNRLRMAFWPMGQGAWMLGVTSPGYRARACFACFDRRYGSWWTIKPGNTDIVSSTVSRALRRVITVERVKHAAGQRHQNGYQLCKALRSTHLSHKTVLCKSARKQLWQGGNGWLHMKSAGITLRQ